jgi:uncharacterized protein
MKSFVMWVVLVAALPWAKAASFDCKVAKTAMEKAICGDAGLSSLNEEMGQAYKRALMKAGEGEFVLRADQRAWLAETTDKCGGEGAVGCIRSVEMERVQKLTAWPAFDPKSMTEYRVTDASKYFDFVVRMQAHAFDAGDDTREGPGRVMVFTKGAAKPLQTIEMDNIFVSLDKGGKPLVNTAPLYDYQGVINVGDFNFDGHEDFAIQNGNHGSYGGPSYSVYLYSTGQSRFVFSAALSGLIEETLGFFGVDGKRKRLSTFAKDGCCYHESVEYAVVGDRPVPVSRVVEDATKSERWVYVSRQRMVNGRWVGKTERVPQAEEGK